MKKYLLAACCLLFAVVSFGQSGKITLTGTIEVNSGEVFPFKIIFTESAGQVSGYSFTYQAPDDTKAAITGTFDRANKTLSFKETEIVYSHDVRTKAYMCLIDARLEMRRSGSGNTLKGPIASMEADKTACTGGRIIFSNEDELRNLFDPHEKFDTVISMKKKGPAPPAAKVAPTPEPVKPLVTDKITTGVEKIYEWYSDTVILDIWDGGEMDGDRVTLQYNGSQCLLKYPLQTQKKQFRLPVSRTGIDIITILAETEGFEPPNTASIMLTDGSTQYSVLAYNTKGLTSVIKIRKAKQGK